MTIADYDSIYVKGNFMCCLSSAGGFIHILLDSFQGKDYGRCKPKKNTHLKIKQTR